MITHALLVLTATAAGLWAQPRLTPLDAEDYRKLVAAHKGQILLVDFWATWCSPCVTELPQLVQMQSRLGGRVRLVMVSADEPEDEAEALKVLVKSGAPMPAYIKRTGDDDAFIRAVDPAWSGAVPALFLYDREGRKVRSFVGERDLSEVEAAIRKLP